MGIVLECSLQYIFHLIVDLLDVLLIEFDRLFLRVDLCLPEDLVRDPISHAGGEALIQEKRFERGRAG